MVSLLLSLALIIFGGIGAFVLGLSQIYPFLSNYLITATMDGLDLGVNIYVTSNMNII